GPTRRRKRRSQLRRFLRYSSAPPGATGGGAGRPASPWVSGGDEAMMLFSRSGPHPRSPNSLQTSCRMSHEVGCPVRRRGTCIRVTGGGGHGEPSSGRVRDSVSRRPNVAKNKAEAPLSAAAESIVGDLLKLMGDHFRLLRAEFKEDLSRLETGAVSLGSGAGLTALGGLPGTLALVHLLHSATRLPLWVCYGLASGAALGAGVSLLYEGRREVAEVNLLPRET